VWVDALTPTTTTIAHAARPEDEQANELLSSVTACRYTVSCEVEQEFFTDLVSVFKLTVLQRKKKWPDPTKIVDGLEKVMGFRYVDFERLISILDEEWAPDNCRSFMRHYGRFGPLRYEYQYDEHQGTTLERKIAMLLENSKAQKKDIKAQHKQVSGEIEALYKMVEEMHQQLGIPNAPKQHQAVV